MEDSITESLKSKKIDPVIVPGGCTKYIQAPDICWNKPTHVTDHSSTAIDLVFVNNPHRIVSHGVQDFGVGYHSIVFAVKKAGICKGTKGVREVRSYKRYNKEYFCRDVNEVPWNVIEVSEDMDGAVNAWNTLFNDVANRHAPIKKLRTKNTTKPWISDDIKELMAERDYAFKVAKKIRW